MCYMITINDPAFVVLMFQMVPYCIFTECGTWIKCQDSEIFLLVILHVVIAVELLSKQIFPTVSARNFGAQLFIFDESD